MRNVPIAALAIALGTGCVTVKTEHLSPQRYAPITVQEVTVFLSPEELQADSIRYERLGMMFAKGSHSFTDQQQMVRKLREEAAKIGANGLVMQQIQEGKYNWFWGTEDPRTGSAMAVRWWVEEAPAVNAVAAREPDPPSAQRASAANEPVAAQLVDQRSPAPPPSEVSPPASRNSEVERVFLTGCEAGRMTHETAVIYAEPQQTRELLRLSVVGASHPCDGPPAMIHELQVTDAGVVYRVELIESGATGWVAARHVGVKVSEEACETMFKDQPGLLEKCRGY